MPNETMLVFSLNFTFMYIISSLRSARAKTKNIYKCEGGTEIFLAGYCYK